jgi:hypothetical protein
VPYGEGSEEIRERLEVIDPDVGVAGRGLDVSVTEEGLDQADIDPGLEEVGREGVPERVEGDLSGDSGPPDGSAEAVL